MNPQETEQVVARDELWVPTAERVNISTTNVRLETTVKQKEETFQVVIDVIKNSTCIKAFTISADVPEILMQQFWYTITKIKDSESYEFLLADKKCVIDAEVFRKILDICPRKEGEDFTEVQNDEDTLTFLIDLGYSGPLHKENVDYPSLIWEDIAYQIDHRWEKKSRRENMPYPRFIKVIIDYFLSKLKSLKKLKFQHFHTIKDDGVIIQSESSKMFIMYSTGQIPPKKSRGKGLQGKKTADTTEESIDISDESDESDPEPLIERKTSRRKVVKKKATISVDDNIIPEPGITQELGKSISLTEAEEEAAAREVHDTHARIVTESVLEPARTIRQSNIAFRDTSSVLKKRTSGTKLDDALFKALKRHTADLVEKYSVLPAPESSKKKESKKSPEEIIRIKREQEEKKQEPTYTIKLTDKAALEEFDLKSALFKSMHKNKSANRNPTNYRIYHALIEALIEDENAMDKEVADTVKDHKRKHDGGDDDNDDDEGPLAGSNQGKSTKKRRKRESESAKKPSTTKESSKGKDPKVGSKTGKSALAKDPVEEPTEKVIIDEQTTEDIPISNEGHVSDLEDTDNTHMPKIPDTTTWFRPIPEEERPASPELEWVIPPIDLPEAENNWVNAFAKAHQDPDENKLHNKIDDIGSFIRWYCRRIGKEELSKADLEGPTFMMVKGFHENNISLQFQMEECHKLLTNQIDLVNPEGHRIVPDISNPLPLGGPPGQVTIQPQFFFNKDLEYLLTGDKERNRALSISKLKAALYQDFGLEELLGIESYQTKLNLEQPNWDASDFPFKEDYTIVFKPRAAIYRDRDDNRKIMRIDEVHKFNDGTLTRIKEKLDFMEYGHVAKECQKPKRAKDAAYHKEKMLLCKQEKARFQLNVEQANWRDDTDNEPGDQELEARYMYMAQIQEVTPDAADISRPIFDTEPLHKEKGDTNITIDSLDMSTNGETVDQDDDDLARERDLLASLIEKLKCKINDNKNHNKFLESSNKALVEKLKDLKKFQAKLDRYHDMNYASKVAIDCAKDKGDLMSYKMESKKSFNEYTRKINDLNQTILEMKKELFAHQETISIMSQEKEAQKKFHKTCEDKELKKVIALENKIKVLDDIVYKTGQSFQTMNMLNRNCKTSFVKPEFLKKTQRANPRLYDIGCYNDNLALMLALESDETIRLAQESRSKLSDLIRPFDYKNLNNLYDLFVPQREKSPEQQCLSKESKMSHTYANIEIFKESFNKQTTLLEKQMDESIPWDQKCKSSKELFKIKEVLTRFFDGGNAATKIAKRTYLVTRILSVLQNTIEGNFCPQIREESMRT
ncbi:hypothetical protein Tco_0006750 [Tanacetum coccineum]